MELQSISRPGGVIFVQLIVFHQVRNVIEINILSDLERTRFLLFDTHPNHKASGASFINLLDFLGHCQFAFLIFGPYVIILYHNFPLLGVVYDKTM